MSPQNYGSLFADYFCRSAEFGNSQYAYFFSKPAFCSNYYFFQTMQLNARRRQTRSVGAKVIFRRLKSAFAHTRNINDPVTSAQGRLSLTADIATQNLKMFRLVQLAGLCFP